MDKEELQKNIALYYSKLPPKAQEVFAKMEWLENLKKISEKYLLKDESAQTLATETTLVLLGIIHLDEYKERIYGELGLEKDSADKMLAEIEELILKDIRGQLVEAFDTNIKSETEEIKTFTENLDKRIEKLPSEIKKAVAQSNYQENLYAIAKEYQLNVEQMNTLETAVTDLITGAINPDKFENSIENSIGLPPEKRKGLVGDVNKKIFLKIRELLKTASAVNDSRVLDSAGIKITENKGTLPNLERLELTDGRPAENRESLLQKIEKPENINTILSQKLSTPVQAPKVKTEYSLPNIQSSQPSPNGASPQNKVDPYREIPE